MPKAKKWVTSSVRSNFLKAVFFDWDGTLVDSIPLLFASHNHVRQNFGLPLWTPEEYSKAILFSTRELYPKIFGDNAQAAQDLLYEYIKENHLAQLVLMHGVEDLIISLHIAGVPMGVVSNKRNDVLRREIEHLGWDKYFGVYNGAGVAEKDKPSGVPLIYAVEQHPSRLSIDDVIYVGDTESDLSCAKEAGCPVLYIDHAPGRPDLIESYKPTYVVQKPSEIKQLLMDVLGI